MTASVRHHRLVRRFAVAALAVGALGLTAPLATAETLSSGPDTVHTAPAEQPAPAPAERPAPAPAPQPAEKPAEEATARPDVENKSETKGE